MTTRTPRDKAYTQKVKKQVKRLGADLVGVADLQPLKELHLDPPDLLEPFQSRDCLFGGFNPGAGVSIRFLF